MKDLEFILRPIDLMLSLKMENTAEINPISRSHAEILFSLFQAVSRSKNQSQKRQIITNWMKNSIRPEQIHPSALYSAFRQSIKKARDFRESLIREFVPDLYKFPFTSDGIVRVTDDPAQLLTMVFDPPGDPFFKKIRSFEALVFWILSLRYLLMSVNNNYLQEQEHLRKITLFLEDKFFTPGGDRALRQQPLIVSYDPKNEYRFAGIGEIQGFPNELYASCFRIITINNRKIHVLFDGRDKREEDVFRKILLKSRGEMPIAFDQHAISLTFISKEDLEDARGKIFSALFSNGAYIFNWKQNGIGGKKTNPASSNKFQIEQLKGYVQGALLEVQISTLENAFNSRFSMGEENHKFYRLSQLMPFFRLIFPQEYYIDWDSTPVQEKMHALQKARILSNFQGSF
jgi:hypothetical protein